MSVDTSTQSVDSRNRTKFASELTSFARPVSIPGCDPSLILTAATHQQALAHALHIQIKLEEMHEKSKCTLALCDEFDINAGFSAIWDMHWTEDEEGDRLRNNPLNKPFINAECLQLFLNRYETLVPPVTIHEAHILITFIESHTRSYGDFFSNERVNDKKNDKGNDSKLGEQDDDVASRASVSSAPSLISPKQFAAALLPKSAYHVDKLVAHLLKSDKANEPGPCISRKGESALVYFLLEALAHEKVGLFTRTNMSVRQHFDLVAAFGQLDRHDSGLTTAHEIRKFMSLFGITLTAEQLYLLMARCTVSLNGRISYSEFMSFILP